MGEYKMKYIFMLTWIALLFGCSTTPVILKHPETGGIVQCGPYKNNGIAASAGAMREIQCVQDYTSQGYHRIEN
jgi:uncharacterized lipoprotein YajG